MYLYLRDSLALDNPERSLTDRAIKEASSMSIVLTAEYLDYLDKASAAHNMLIYYGDRIPSTIIQIRGAAAG